MAVCSDITEFICGCPIRNPVEMQIFKSSLDVVIQLEQKWASIFTTHAGSSLWAPCLSVFTSMACSHSLEHHNIVASV